MRQAMQSMVIAAGLTTTTVLAVVWHSLWLPQDDPDAVLGNGTLLGVLTVTAALLVAMFLVIGAIQGAYAMRCDNVLRTAPRILIVGIAGLIPLALAVTIVFVIVGG